MKEKLFKDKSVTTFLKWLPAILLLLFLIKFIFGTRTATWLMKAFSPFLGAIGIVYLIYPIIRFLRRKLGFPRWAAILLSYIIFLGVLLLIVTIVIPSVVESAKNLFGYIPTYSTQISEWLSSTYEKTDVNEVRLLIELLQENVDVIFSKSGEIMNKIINGAIIQVVNVTAAVFKFVLMVTISVYMAIEQENLALRAEKLLRAIFNTPRVMEIKKRLWMIHKVFQSYIAGKILDSLIVGIVCAIILSIMQIHYTPLIALIVGVTNMIPYFGPIIGAIPAVLIALINRPIEGLWVGIVILILQQVDGNFLGPKILGDQVGVRPFWVITAITLGGALFGPLGMLLGVPLIVVVKNLIEEWVAKRLAEKEVEIREK